MDLGFNWQSQQVEDDRKKFEQQKNTYIDSLSKDKKINQQSLDLTATTDQHHFSYMWHWLGVPIIQMPTDIIVLQEIIWKEKPQVIIETGIARGGSVIFFSSMLQLLGEGQVIAIDIDIRPHNYASIVTHPCSHRIKMIEGSSIDQKVVAQVKNSIPSNARTMVILDSNHTHEHVMQELAFYAPLVTEGQYLVVADTVIEHIPSQKYRPRPWGVGNNPQTALNLFMKQSNDFEVDKTINGKLILSSNINGYLKRIKREGSCL